jgi:hypothetical protein
MTDPFDNSQIDLPLETKAAVGRYDKLQEGGMATRFVKGIWKPERTSQATVNCEDHRGIAADIRQWSARVKNGMARADHATFRKFVADIITHI